jgi:hypothetical protein
LGASVHGPGAVSEALAARLGSADDWLPLGPAALPAKAASARFFAHPWYGVAALCFETDAPLHLSRFARPPGPAAGPGFGTLARALAALGLGAAAVLGWRLLGRQRAAGLLARLTDRPLTWLASLPEGPAARRERLVFGGLAAGLVLGGLALGGQPGRVALGLAGLALVPVWRAGAAGMAARLSRHLPGLGPWLDGGAGRTYFLGFALALALAALAGSLTLAPVAEFCAQAGLYAFVAGLCLQLPHAARNRAERPEDVPS